MSYSKKLRLRGALIIAQVKQKHHEFLNFTNQKKIQFPFYCVEALDADMSYLY